MPAQRTTRQGSHWRGRETTKPAPPSLIGVLVWTVPPLEPFLDHEAERGAEAGARKTEKQLSCHNQPAHVSSLLRCPGNERPHRSGIDGGGVDSRPLQPRTTYLPRIRSGARVCVATGVPRFRGTHGAIVCGQTSWRAGRIMNCSILRHNAAGQRPDRVGPRAVRRQLGLRSSLCLRPPPPTPSPLCGEGERGTGGEAKTKRVDRRRRRS